MTDIVVIAAHPSLEHSRVTVRLMRALRRLPPELGIDLRDLYARYPDYLIDIAAEQKALALAKLIVWLHPIHWYSMPPLMKLWVDDVLAFGWAYGPGGTALRGKDLWLVTSTGGPQDSYRAESYNNHTFDEFLPPYRQTAALTGMRFAPPLVLHGAHRVSDAEIDAHVASMIDQLRRHPNWPGLARQPHLSLVDVPAHARPEAA